MKSPPFESLAELAGNQRGTRPGSMKIGDFWRPEGGKRRLNGRGSTNLESNARRGIDSLGVEGLATCCE